MILIVRSDCKSERRIPIVDKLNVSTCALEAGVIKMENTVLILRAITKKIEDVIVGQGQGA